MGAGGSKPNNSNGSNSGGGGHRSSSSRRSSGAASKSSAAPTFRKLTIPDVATMATARKRKDLAPSTTTESGGGSGSGSASGSAGSVVPAPVLSAAPVPSPSVPSSTVGTGAGLTEPSFIYFLHVDGVTGDIQAPAQHAGDLAMISYTWGSCGTNTNGGSGAAASAAAGGGISRPAPFLPSTGAGGGGGAGIVAPRPMFSHLTVRRYVDGATPSMYMTAAEGRVIPTLRITMSTVGAVDKSVVRDLFRIELSQVVVTGYRMHGSDTSFPVEEVSLSFQSMAMGTSATSSTISTSNACWNVGSNQSCADPGTRLSSNITRRGLVRQQQQHHAGTHAAAAPTGVIPPRPTA